jgi:hypothetical protein
MVYEEHVIWTERDPSILLTLQPWVSLGLLTERDKVMK